MKFELEFGELEDVAIKNLVNASIKVDEIFAKYESFKAEVNDQTSSLAIDNLFVSTDRLFESFKKVNEQIETNAQGISSYLSELDLISMCTDENEYRIDTLAVEDELHDLGRELNTYDKRKMTPNAEHQLSLIEYDIKKYGYQRSVLNLNEDYTPDEVAEKNYIKRQITRINSDINAMKHNEEVFTECISEYSKFINLLDTCITEIAELIAITNEIESVEFEHEVEEITTDKEKKINEVVAYADKVVVRMSKTPGKAGKWADLFLASRYFIEGDWRNALKHGWESMLPPALRFLRDHSKISGVIHIALDIAGLIPEVGWIFDLVNASIYLAEGKLLYMGVSLIGVIPGLGHATTLAKYGIRLPAEALEKAAKYEKVQAALGYSLLAKSVIEEINEEIHDYDDTNDFKKDMGIILGSFGFTDKKGKNLSKRLDELLKKLKV